MKIKVLFAIALICIAMGAAAQGGDLMVQGVSPKLFLVHKVAPKETWYSIGRLYNISPKELAPYNNLKLETSLNIGQELKIPLGETNFSQNGVKAPDEVMVPVYHTVQEKEWMYRISQHHNKVPVENLEKWNGITNDNLRAGTKLIIGYLKVKQGQSSLASKAKTVAPVTATAEPPVVVNKPVSNPPAGQPKTTPNKPAAEQTTTTTSSPVVTKPVDEPKPVVNRNIDYNGGYFRSQYGNAGRNATGMAGVFKSTSGWQDGKYYALMNNVPVGTIIRVDHPLTRKSVYAKVLGQLPEMKESTGLAVRLSDAAAAELGAGAFKFNVEVSY